MGNQREKCLASMIPKRKWYRRPFDIVMGKAIFYFILYLLMAIYMYTAVTQWFGLPNLGDYSVFLQFILPYILACIFMAMVLSVLVYRREDCIMLLVFLSVRHLLAWLRDTQVLEACFVAVPIHLRHERLSAHHGHRCFNSRHTERISGTVVPGSGVCHNSLLHVSSAPESHSQKAFVGKQSHETLSENITKSARL